MYKLLCNPEGFLEMGKIYPNSKIFKIMTNSNYIKLYSTMVVRVKFPFHTFKGCRNLNEIVLSYNQSRYCLNQNYDCLQINEAM